MPRLSIVGATRIFSQWRYLLAFWVALLVTAIAGGVALQLLGPPSDHLNRDGGPSSPYGAIASSLPWFDPSDPDQRSALAPAALARNPPALWPVQPAPLDIATTASEPAPVRTVVQPTPLSSHAQAVGSADQEAAQPVNQILITLHPAGSEDTKALAERLAARLGLTSSQISTGAAGGSRPGVVIRFYSAGDHTMARRIGSELSKMGYPWRIENLSNPPPANPHHALEVWLMGR